MGAWQLVRCIFDPALSRRERGRGDAARIRMASGGVADRERGDGSPQRVIRGEDAVVAMPVPSWWGHEIGKPVQELAR